MMPKTSIAEHNKHSGSDSLRPGAAFAVLLLLFALTVTGVGCDSQEAPPPPPVSQLRAILWNTPTETTVRSFFDQTLQQFNTLDDHAQVTPTYIPDEEYKAKLALDMALNAPSDIFMTWSAGFLQPFVSAEKVFDLTPALEADPAWRDSFYPHILDNLSYDNRAYAIPVARTVAGVFYNTTIFENLGLTPPRTFTELETVVQTLAANKVTPFALGNEFPWVGGMFGGLLIHRIGGESLYQTMAAGETPWLDPTFLRAGELLQRLQSQGAFPKNMSTLSYEDALSMFKKGKAAMLVMGSWIISRFGEDNHAFPEQVGFFPFPEVEGGLGTRDDWMGQSDYNLAISINCQDTDGAIRFLKAFTSLESQRQLVEHTGTLPSVRLDLDTLDLRPLTRQVISETTIMSSQFLFFDILLGQELGGTYNETIRTILEGSTPETAFAKLQQTAQATLPAKQ